MSPIHSASAKLLAILDTTQTAVFLNNGRLALWPKTHEELGAPVIILSVPRSGTYLTGAVFEALGYVYVPVHAQATFCTDVRFQIWQGDKLPYKVPPPTELPGWAVGNLLLPGQVIVSHCGRTPEIEDALKDVKKIYLYRDLREVLISHARARNKHLRAVGERELGLLEFIESDGPNLRALILEARTWRDHPDTLAIPFYDLINSDPKALAERLCAFMQWDFEHTQVCAAISAAQRRDTTTKLTGGRSVVGSDWSEECEAWYSEHLASIHVEPKG